MRGGVLLGGAILALATLLAAPAARAATAEEFDSFYARADVDLAWMKTAIKSLSTMLDQARRARDAKQIDCVDPRLAEAQKIVSGSDDAWIRLREAAAGQDFATVQKESGRIHGDRTQVEALVKLVGDCQQRINKPGGFTEVTERGPEWAGDPTMEGQDDGRLEPLPPGFEPPQEPSASTH